MRAILCCVRCSVGSRLREPSTGSGIRRGTDSRAIDFGKRGTCSAAGHGQREAFGTTAAAGYAAACYS